MTKIISIVESNRKNKRFKVTLEDGQAFHFGLKKGLTFIDHKNVKKRENYRLRHYANETERYLIDTLTPSPALYSWALLWGESDDIMKNIDSLNKCF